jgi:hypothetical protein
MELVKAEEVLLIIEWDMAEKALLITGIAEKFFLTLEWVIAEEVLHGMSVEV